MSVDLAVPLRTAIVDNSDIAPLLATYLGAPAAFTRRPVPSDAPYPMVVVSPDVVPDDGAADVLNSQRPVVVRDLAVYGRNDSAAHYRAVESIAELLQLAFHRNKSAISVDGYRVLEIIAEEPIPAPTDDEETIGRIVMLTVSLQQVA